MVGRCYTIRVRALADLESPQRVHVTVGLRALRIRILYHSQRVHFRVFQFSDRGLHK